MILVRDIFQLKFGKARDAVATWKEGLGLFRKAGYGGTTRLLTDLVGQYYTIVLETTYESLADYEKMGRTMGDDEWKSWYQRVVALTESGRREIFNIVE